MKKLYFSVAKTSFFLLLIATAAFLLFKGKNVVNFSDVNSQNSSMNQDNLEELKTKKYDLSLINKCLKDGNVLAVNKCLKNFFSELSKNSGPEYAMNFLLFLLKEDKKFKYCHYSLHGIGEGSIVFFKGNLGKALQLYNLQNMILDFSQNCGDGFFHGLIVSLSEKNFLDKQSLTEKIGIVCAEFPNDNDIRTCFHGFGHALYTYLEDNNLEEKSKEAMKYCDEITLTNKILELDSKESCYTGFFMETLYSESSEKLVNVKDGILNFSLCDAQDNIHKQFCYLEHSSFFISFSKDGKNFLQNITYCKQIDSEINRIMCNRLMIIIAIREKYEKVFEMCKIPISAKERIFCKVGIVLNSETKCSDVVNFHEQRLCEKMVLDSGFRREFRNSDQSINTYWNYVLKSSFY